MRAYVLFTLVLAAWSASYAQNPPVRTMESTEFMVWSECDQRADKSPSSDRDAFVRDCRYRLTPEAEQLKIDLAQAEQAMVEAYAKVKAKFVPRITTPPWSSLLAAQRAWVKFREAHCAFDVEWAAGPYYGSFKYAKCAMEEARKREAYLKGLLQ